MSDPDLAGDDVDGNQVAPVEASGDVSSTVLDPTPLDPTDQLVEDDDDELDGGLAQEVLQYLATAIVDEPDAVRISVEERRRGVELRLVVAQGDMGKVIGRRGRTAQAIRTVVRAAAAKDGTDVGVEIVD